MSKSASFRAIILVILAVGAFLGAAHAERLVVDPDAPALAHYGAAALLYLHIGGGTIGLLTGITAVLVEKGAFVHRTAGKLFFVSMFIAYLVGAGVAPFLETGQRPNFVAGVLALYLLITGVRAARENTQQVDRGTWIGLIIAASITLLGVGFMITGFQSPSGTVDGSPPQAFYLFTIAGLFAVYGELNIVLRRVLTETDRIIRHLWRMCVSFFIASGSLFFGQPQVFSDAFNASLGPAILSFLPLIFLAIWLVRARLGYFRQAT